MSASLIFSGAALGQTLYYEDFESLALGPSIDEGLKASAVWTKGPPTGWLADDSKVPGVGTSADGVTEWAGWSFANKDWWVKTAGGQRREEFALGTGTVMIADPDEWDDLDHAFGFLETYVSTPNLPVAATEANSLVLAFDSSWRPEGFDDGGTDWPVGPEGENINNQTALISASFNGAAAVDVVHWDSLADGEFFHDHFPNESVLIPLSNPAGLTGLKLTFGMTLSANDWWWAVDNVTVGTPPLVVGLAATGVDFTARIAEGLGKTVDQTKPITVQLDGTTVTPVTLSQEGNQISLKYSQAPQVWAPRSTHTVKISYTSNEGKAIEETRTFVAPSYTSATATPTVVTATIAETDWLTVAEGNGGQDVKLSVDGTAVTPITVTRVDIVDLPDTITVTYTSPTPYAPNSTHTVGVEFKTVGGSTVADSATFTAPDWKTIPASFATAAGTGAQAGLRFRTYQIETNRPANIATSEAQLRGELGPSLHDPTGEVNGAFEVDFVNFEQGGANAGSFNADAAGDLAVPDALIPGIGGGGLDFITGEARTYIEFPAAGLYTMIVNSDDGFGLWTGTTNSPTELQLGAWDGTRGATDTAFYFQVNQPGVYFFRLLWFEGDGGASVEWLTLNADGTRALVNGTQPGALKSYRVRTVPEPVVTPGGISGYAFTDGKLVLTYSGTLKSATTLGGAYTAVTGASSPYSATPSEGQSFFLAE